MLVHPYSSETWPLLKLEVCLLEDRRWMSLGNGTRSVPPSHIEIVAESLCGWACLRESVLIGGSNVASRRGFEIGDFLQYGFDGNVQKLSIRLCCGWSMALRE
ncbi:hypothetical protein TNCV_2661551 [Trichonephila clavipes]|nr:hypothetical protein TNCV_2661551 [Trichonephila clavipes]